MYPQVTLRQRGRELVFLEGVARAVLSFLRRGFPTKAANPTEAVSSRIAQHMRAEERALDRMQALTGYDQQQAREALRAFIRTTSPTLRQVWDWLLTMKIQIAPEHGVPLLQEHPDWLMRPEAIGGSSIALLTEYHLTQCLRADLNQQWFTILTANVSGPETEGAAS